MSEVATKNLTFWDTTNYKYPGFGQTAQVSDGLGGTIGITYNQIDYDDRAWKGKPDGDTPITEERLLSGEIGNQFTLTGQVKGITATMPQIRTIGRENNYSVTLDFSNYKASLTDSKVTDGATCGDTYLAISRFFNGSKAGYTTITVTATTLDGSPVNLTDWKLFNSGILAKGHNARVFLDAATQTISGKNSQGKQEFSPTPPNPGTSFGTDTGLGLFQLPNDQRYTSITLTFKQKKIKGTIPNDLHDIYFASNTTSTSPASATPETKPMDINNGLQLHLPLNKIVENAAKEKEVVDISAGKLNGKVHGTPEIVADARFGNCINFDSTDDYIELPTATIPETGEITISFWANGGKSLPNQNSIILAVDKSNHRVVNIHLPWSNSNVYFDCGNTTTSNDSFDRIYKIAQSADFQDKWTYWVFTKNVATGEMKIYLNGVLWQSGTGKEKPLSSITTVKFGSGYGSYNGKVAHLRIYDRVLSPEEINECMKVDETPPPMDINSGLQLHLPLNEIVENAAKEKEVVDVSAGKLNGKVHGATVVADDRFGNCINFDGVDDYIELPVAAIPGNNEITVSFWANGGKSLPKGNSIIVAYNRSENMLNHMFFNVHLPWSDSKIYFDCGYRTTSAQGYDRIEKLAEAVDFKDKWTHWTFTKNVATGEMKIYQNGSLWQSGTGKNQQLGSVTMVKFGCDPDTLFYHGKVAHLRIYDRVLSEEEINECMKVDGTPPLMDINRGLQLHLPLNKIVENAAKEKEVVDVSAGKLNGKVYGEPEIVADPNLGNCINFDGVDDYVELSTATIPETGEITISFWANGGKSLPKESSVILAQEKGDHRVVNIELPWSNSIIHFDCGIEETYSERVEKIAEAVDFKDKWHYWTFTKNAATGEMNIYQNGSLWQSGTGKHKQISSITKVRFGCGYGFYDGKVAHLRIYERVLSLEEINECMKVDGTPPPMDINSGLQLHLPLNEIVENAAKEKEIVDVSPAKLKGKVHGATVVADDRFGNCINFNGVDDYIELPEMNIDYSQGFTLGVWVNYKSFKYWSRIIDFAIGHKNNNIFLFNQRRNNYLSLGVYTPIAQATTPTARLEATAIPEVNQWLYLTATIDKSGNAKIYKDGQEVCSGFVGVPSSINRTKNYIAKSLAPAAKCFHGQMLNLRVYNRPLSPEEINECMKVDETPPPMDINRGLQLHLPLNEIVENAESEKEVVDVSAGKLNGKVYGTPEIVADPNLGNCINFDGVDDYVELSTATIPETGEITISFWANGGKSLPKESSVMLAQEKGDHRVVNIELPWSNSVIHFDCGIEETYSERVEKIAEAVDFKDKWHYWTFTKNAATGEMNIYQNGSLWQSGTGKHKPINSITKVRFGCGYGFYEGKVAHLRIYDRVLSLEEINECMKVDGTPPPMDINRGLQLHLPLNEIVENAAKEKEVVDISAGKLNGKIYGPTVVANPRFGNCLNFNGNHDYIIINPMPNFPSEAITVLCWVRSNNTKKEGTILSYAKSSAQSYNEFQIYNIKNITPTVNNKWHSTRVAVNDGEWHCVAITWQSSDGEFKVYKDGTEVHSKVISKGNPIATGGALVLGQEQDKLGGGFAASQAFEGQMAHLRMYNRVLSPEDINECMKLDGTPPPMDINSGLQLHLPLNEIVENAESEKEVVDVSLAKLNCKVHSATVVADDRFGNCINLDGVDDYIELPTTTMSEKDEITISFWANGDKSLPKSNSIISAENKNSNRVLNIHLTWGDSQLHFDCGNQAGSFDRISKIAEATDFKDKWTYWTFTKNVTTGEMNIYLNGSLWNSGTAKNKALSPVTKAMFGCYIDRYFYHGKVAHLRIYDRVLSPEEINECMKVDGTPPPMDINRGLQLHLPLNEIVENAAKEKEIVDASGGKLNGKVNGEPTVVADDRFGKCLSFDGVDDYIELPTTTIPETGEITISFWANGGKSLPNQNSIILAVDKSNHRVVNIHLPWSNSNVYFDCGNTTTSNDSFDRISKIAQSADFQDKWTYWVFTKNVATGEMNIYLNGVLWQSGTGKEKPLSSITTVKFGSGYGFYDGKVAHLRIYDRVLSPEEINECMKVDGTPPPMDINRGLQLHLPLNEIVENAAKEKEIVDASGGKLNGKVNGATVVADDHFGNCINFDGVDDYIELPTTTIPETGEITISFWANGGKSLPNQNSIILAVDKSNHRVVNIHLPWSNSNVYFDCGNTTTSNDSFDRISKIAQSADFQDKWTYWVFTKNVATGEMKIYLNGVLWQSGTGKEKPLSSITTVKFGSGYGFYNGKVAHLRIYDRVLSPEEINELMTVDEADKADSTSTTDGTDATGETDSTSTTDGTDATGETDSASTTDGTDATGETDSTSTTDGTDATGETDSTSTNDGTDTTGETDSTSTTDGTDATGKTDSTSTTDGTDATGKTDSTSTTDGTSQPVDINSGLHFNLPLNEIVENSAKEKEVVDASGGKLNGKVYGAKIITDPDFGDCISFDGVDDYIELPPTAIPETNKITISFWANGGESLPKQNSILLAEDKTNNRVVNIHLPWSDSSVCFDCGNKTTSFDRIEQLAQVSDFKGKWNHWAFTKNVATEEMKIYLNGSLWQTVTGKNQELSQITHIKLGCGYGFYEGKVAHLRIYDRVLSQEEINELMKVNQPVTTSTTGKTETTPTTDGTETTSTTDEIDTTQKPMEYQVYQVKGNPTIKTGYKESEWTAVIAGFNCGAKQKHKASAFTIMPVVDNGEWKIKCDLKDTDDRYWDVAVLFIRNNMVNRTTFFVR